jgi:CP family cyanate transporter-like MFS transporter
MPAVRCPSRHAAVALVAVLAAALNLRLGIAQVGPLLEEVRADTGMSSTMAGMLGTIPVMCFGVFSFTAAPLTRRIGMRATVILALSLVATGTFGRAVAGPPVLIVGFTVPIGVGAALLGVSLPAMIKHLFPGRAATITGVYVGAVAAGAAIPTGIMVPLAELLGGWREAFAAGALAALAALPLWLRRRAGDEPPSRPPGRREPPGRQALVLAASFGLQSLVFAAALNWIVAVFIDAGWPASKASIAAAGLPLLTCIASLVMPAVSSAATRSRWILSTGVAMMVGLAGIAFAPMLAPALWIVVLGYGTGAAFPLVMMLPLDLRDHPADVAELTGWMLGLGYVIAAGGPALVGVLRDLTGSFTVPLLVLSVAGLVSGVIGAAPALRRGALAPAQ